jgi:hypothetical protein
MPTSQTRGDGANETDKLKPGIILRAGIIEVVPSLSFTFIQQENAVEPGRPVVVIESIDIDSFQYCGLIAELVTNIDFEMLRLVKEN